jgi:hypothetical protein
MRDEVDIRLKIKQDALKYNTQASWRKDPKSLYHAAYRRKMLSECIGHMTISKHSYTDDDLKQDALKYSKRSEWKEKSGGPYSVARSRGLLDMCCKHMPNRILTDEELKADAMKYSTRDEWSQNARGKYGTAQKRKILDYCCEHMTNQLHTYTDIELIEDAAKYNSRTEWCKQSCRYYVMAVKRKILDQCCSHMVNLRYNKLYSDEDLFVDAAKYSSRMEWYKESKGKYEAASRRNLLQYCCAHMKYVETFYTHDIGIIYAYIFSDNSIYIGLTINAPRRFRSHTAQKGPVFRKIQQGFSYEYKVLEDGIANLDLSDRETFYIEQYKKDKTFIVMNSYPGGGRGSLRRSSIKPSIIFDQQQQNPQVVFHPSNSL